MNLLTRIRKSNACRIPVSLLTIFLLILPPGLMPANPPDWWQSRGVLKAGAVAADYAVINQGQLKNFVNAAVLELDEMLPDGAGDPLHQLVTAWATSTSRTDDYAAVNLGQLKAMAKLVYDRFKDAGYVTEYPWDSSAFSPDDYALASIGQAKNLFAFDLSTLTFDAYHSPKGDGIAYKWKLHYGLDPTNPNLANETALGGLTYLQKYQQGLDPTKADSDGDGVSDWQDRYPNDPRRSDDIPMKFYAVTDLSSYLPDNVKDTFNAKEIALDDDHRVAFFGTSDALAGSSQTGHVYRWQNGTLTEPLTFSMAYPGSDASNYWATMSLGDTEGGEEGYAHSELAVSGINATGTLASTAGTNYLVGHTGSFGNFIVTANWVTICQVALPLTTYPPPDGNSGDAIAVNNAGDTLDQDLHWTPIAGSSDPEVGTYRHRTLFNKQEVPALSEGSVVFAYVEAPLMTCYALNHHGAFLVKGWADPYFHTRTFKYCEEGLLSDAPDGISQMNGAHQAIGNTSDYPYNAWFGFETSSGHWDTFNFLDLLKWPGQPAGTRDDWEKFHSALWLMTPKFITDPDPATLNATVAGKLFPNGVPRFIQFHAYFADDSPDGSTASTTWTEGDFVLEFDSSDPDHSNWHYRLKTIWTSPGFGVAQPVAMNNDGSMVAMMQSEGDDDGKRVAVLDGFQFEVANKGDLRWGIVGFDPPIAGDAKAHIVRTGSEVENDSVERTYWTSVCRTSTKRPADWMDGRWYPDLNINKSLRVHFDSAAAAVDYELIVPSAYENLLKIGPTSGDPNTKKVSPLQAKTPFAIKGLLTTNTIDSPEIWLVSKGQQGQPEHPSATLKVALLPEQHLTLGISFVQDTNNPATKIWSDPAKLARIDKNLVLYWICTHFQQACITFEPATTNVQAATNISFDSAPKNNALDVPSDFFQNNASEYRTVRLQLPKADVRVAFVADMLVNGSGSYLGYSPTSGALGIIKCKAMFDAAGGDENETNKYFPFAAAHEVGHCFELSTRHPSKTDQTLHDNGPFPQWLGITNSLMTDGSMQKQLHLVGETGSYFKRSAWLRHEDWKQANIQAFGLKGKAQ